LNWEFYFKLDSFFTDQMPNVQNKCSPECLGEVDLMNKYKVLNCFGS
jgi:hypothetical protein